MKHFPLIFGVVVMVMAGSFGIMAAMTTDAEPVETSDVHGISERNGNVLLRVAVTEQSRTAYPVITWYIFTPEPAELVHVVNDEETIKETVPAGYHRYTREYVEGPALMTWTVNDQVYKFSVNVTSTSAMMLEDDLGLDMITMLASELQSKINSTVAISIGCLLVAFPFLMAYWRERKSEGYEDVI
jgi:hypothetical protein